MEGQQIEKVVSYLKELSAAETSHEEMFRLCAEKFGEMKKSEFILAIQIAMHDFRREDCL